MDFSKFTSDDFDAKDWINNVFPDQGASQSSKEQFASTLVMKLQLLIQEVAKSLEDTSQQIVQCFLKLNREIANMRQEATLLKEKVLAVERDVVKVEKDTSSAMDALLLLDEAKNRMSDVERALKEVDNWTSLSSGVDVLFQTGDSDVISDRLFQMEQCLDVIGSKVPDYRERRDYLERLKDQFVVAVSPSLVGALTSRNFDVAQYFSKMFSRFNRVADFEKYCYKTVKIDVCSAWRESVASESSISSDELLHDFYGRLLAIWFSQTKFLNNIVRSADALVVDCMRLCVSELQPSVQDALKARLADSGGDSAPVASLTCCKTATDDLVRSLACQLQKSSADFAALFVALYSPFAFFLVNLHKFEQGFLLQRLNSLDLKVSSDFSVARSLVESGRMASAECLSAFNRCQEFAGVFALPSVVKSLKTFFDNYFLLVLRCIDELHGKMKATSCSENVNLENFHHVFTLAQYAGIVLTTNSNVNATFRSRLNELKTLLECGGDISLTDSGVLGIKDKHVADCSRFFELAMRSNEDVINACSTLVSSAPENISSALSAGTNELVVRINSLASDLLTAPVAGMFQGVADLAVWNAKGEQQALTEHLPSFSHTPQEYITKVGQYVITVAHYLEPYTSGDQQAFAVFVQHLTTMDAGACDSDHLVHYWLRCVTEHAAKRYACSILGIKRISAFGCRQLKADIDYLQNVFSDLGATFTADLIDIHRIVETRSSTLSWNPKDTGFTMADEIRETMYKEAQ